MSKPIRRVSDPNLLAIAVMVKHLIIGLMTNKELSRECGLSYLTVCRHTAALHQMGAAHITRFELDSRGASTIRVFKLGKDDDAVAHARPRAIRAREQRRKEMLQRPILRILQR